ncbi:MAG: DUF6351 family protein [Burkholderiaceae bacterium]
MVGYLAIGQRAILITCSAVIDMRGWDDSGLVTQPGTVVPGVIPIHHVWRSFSIRDRLDRQFGDHGNQVMWRFGRGGLLSSVLAPQAFAAMDRWLTTLTADTSAATIEQKVRASKPAVATDFCRLSTDVAQGTKVTDQAVCDADPVLKASSDADRRAVNAADDVCPHPEPPRMVGLFRSRERRT